MVIKINERNRRGIKILDIFYADNQCDYQGYDVIHYFQNKQYYPKAKVFKTIIIDLNKSEEEIFLDFNRSLRRSIRRVSENDKVEFFEYSNPSKLQIEEYVKYFNEFAKSKCIYSCDKPFLEQLSEEGYLRIIGAREKETGEILVYNTFIQNRKRARGLYSASLTYKFLDDKDKKKLIADVNKALEWYTMNLYKGEGYTEYDLGGVTLDPKREDMKGIDEYKMQFGGSLVEEFNYSYGYTIKGKLALGVNKLKSLVWERFK